MPLYIVSNPTSRIVWEDEEEEIAMSSKFHFHRGDVLDDPSLELVETVILEDLVEVFQNKTIANVYTRSMLVTLKLVLQSGYGTETSDSIYNMLMSTFLMFGGWLYAAYVLILISNVMMASSSSGNQFEEMSREIDEFCRAKGLSRKLTGKIKTLYERQFNQHFFNEEAIQQSTPANLRKEIMMHSCSSLIAHVPMFRGIPHKLMENIVTSLKLELFYPGDIIIRAGATGDAMYFIAFGTAAVLSAEGALGLSSQLSLFLNISPHR
jgi:hyperpolarization activated cyclic nucleotide-gated potassium channel 2